MDKWIEVKLSDIGKTYSGLSNKSAKDFGYGKDYIPYLNIYNNSKVNINFFEKVNIKKRENQNKVKYGDIFFTTSSETPDEVGMSSVLLDEVNEVYLNSFCFGFRLNDFNTLRPEFARYYFRGMGFRKQMNYLAQGSTRYNLSKVALLKYKAILPTIPEQSKIAEILTTIDDAIEQTEKIIEKYKRIKQGLLQDLLTKGIDENGNIRSEATHKFKDSPLGRIPVEWECKTFSQISKVRQGLQIAISERYLEPSGEDYYLYITIDYLNNKKNIYYVKNPSKSVVCSKDDILMTRTGDTGTVVTGVEGAFHNNFFLVDFDRDIIEKDYLFYYLDRKIMKDKFINYSGTTTIPDLKHKDFYKTHIVYPKDKNEQKEISKIIKSVNSKILYEKKYLEKLYSIKQGLMQDLLTGKVKVTHLLDKGGKSNECHP